MQTYTRKCPNGSEHTYTLTDVENGCMTRHRWAEKDGKPFLHIMPSESGYCNLFIFCDEAGYVKQGELIVPFEDLKVEQIAF